MGEKVSAFDCNMQGLAQGRGDGPLEAPAVQLCPTHWSPHARGGSCGGVRVLAPTAHTLDLCCSEWQDAAASEWVGAVRRGVLLAGRITANAHAPFERPAPCKLLAPSPWRLCCLHQWPGCGEHRAA
jgi:hypothetical protein